MRAAVAKVRHRSEPVEHAREIGEVAPESVEIARGPPDADGALDLDRIARVDGRGRAAQVTSRRRTIEPDCIVEHAMARGSAADKLGPDQREGEPAKSPFPDAGHDEQRANSGRDRALRLAHVPHDCARYPTRA